MRDRWTDWWLDRWMGRPSYRDVLTHLHDLNLLNHIDIVLGNIASENNAHVVLREHDQKNVTNIVGLSINIPLVLSHFALF